MTPAPRIFRSLDEIPPGFGPSALTIGNFDGVHAGHRKILRRVQEIAAARGLKPSALTFHPHPSKVVAPTRAPRLMSTPAQRAALMGEEGIQQVFIMPFDQRVAHLTPEQFVEQVLVRKLDVRAVVLGHDFCFGNKKSGTVRVMRELGVKYGFSTEEIKPVTVRGRLVSSTAVRQLIEAGLVAQAARMLERPYALDGEVVAGRGVGSKQTVPTLNLATSTEVLPATGVYVTRTHSLDDGRKRPSITNIGYRPTFGESHDLSIETFLLEPMPGERPRDIRVEFLWHVRDERQFPDPQALKQQILHDAGVAQAYFRRRTKWTCRSDYPPDFPSNVT